MVIGLKNIKKNTACADCISSDKRQLAPQITVRIFEPSDRQAFLILKGISLLGAFKMDLLS